MATPSTPDPYSGLTKAHFDGLGWPALIAKASSKQCDAYAKIFAEKAKSLEDAQQKDPSRAARVLMDIALFGFHPRESDRAFHPMVMIGSQRTPIPEDFSETLITIVASLAAEAGDPEFAARLGDVALTVMPKKDKQLIEATIENYLASGAHLFNEKSWESAYLRFRRAVHLLRKPSPGLSTKLNDAFDKFFKETAPAAPLLEVVQTLELCRDYLEKDGAFLAAHASQYTSKAAEAKAWHLCSRLHAMHGQGLLAQNKEADAKAAFMQAAETHVKLAEEAMQRPTPSPLAAARHLLRASKAYRDIEKGSNRAAQLDQMRAEYQRQGVQEIEWVNLADQPDAGALRKAIESVETAIRAAALDAARAAQELPFYEALKLLALCHPPPNKAQIEAIALKQLERGVFQSLIPVTLFDEEGRPFAKAGSFLHENAKGQKLIIEQRMLDWFKTYHLPEAVTIFEAVREQINDEHNIRPELCAPIVGHSPFIPAGRGYLFARGLYAGLIGDFVTAGHLLAPQLEYGIKVALSDAGVIPTVTEASETERPADLNSLFNGKRKELESIFGVDETFELEALLIRRWGCHLRNDIAHGQLSTERFLEPSVRYLWWICLRFCMFGVSPLPKPPRNSQSS